MNHLRTAFAAALLLFQIGAIVYARFVPERYFCWAPYDMQTQYEVDVTVNGRELTEQQIRERYRRPKRGSDNRSAQHVMDIFQGVEERYHSGDRAEITMRYRINGKEEQLWRWPSNR